MQIYSKFLINLQDMCFCIRLNFNYQPNKYTSLSTTLFINRTQNNLVRELALVKFGSVTALDTHNIIMLVLQNPHSVLSVLFGM